MKTSLIPIISLFLTTSIFSQNVGIGTIVPNASAALDVTSTTKGLLPPRMTVEERDLIAGPVAGLFIWCTNCGPLGKAQIYDGYTWTNLSPTETGRNFQGGIIAYVLQPEDPGFDVNVPHGIIVAPNDLSIGIQWYNGIDEITNATGTALGSGQLNTTAIVITQGAGSYAAQLCNNLELNGYSDWFLPSKDELNKLYSNKDAIGSFSENYYWSSSEFDNINAWIQDFSSGVGLNYFKYFDGRVRAVRVF